MKDLAGFVDPFLGNGEIELPEPEGIASTWFFLKAQTGNTHPGACRPFGMVSVCPYSGAYATGYGLNRHGGNGKVQKEYKSYSACGFTHFHHSGTGAVGQYYNYFRVSPVAGNINMRNKMRELVNESAHPGYYSAELKGSGVKAEMTVSEKMAFHRYTFRKSEDKNLFVDFSAGGLIFENMKTFAQEAEIRVESSNAANGYVLMQGIRIYVYIEIQGDALSCKLWQENEILEDSVRNYKGGSAEGNTPFGIVFELSKEIFDESICDMRIGFSLRSIQQAKENMRAKADKTFEDVCLETYNSWNQYLNAICVKGGSEEQKIIFYTALYHSLIKPSDFSSESPFWEQREYFVDFATLWDQYKTQMPLTLTFFPERGRDMVNSMLAAAEHAGKFPTCVILTDEFDNFPYQARCLFHYSIADAFYRGISGIDWRHAKELMVKDIMRKDNREFIEKGLLHPLTHTLDLAEACFCTSQIAKHVEDTESWNEMLKLSHNWKNAYKNDGILGESKYYEGGAFNYSFRLLHNMEERVSMSKGNFVDQLDRFFGYGAPSVKQPGDTSDENYKKYLKWGFSLNRFEGFNNEPDMETPYAYIYGGRHYRTAEVVRAGLRYMFTTGRGGLPGNDDSGGLSSCCVWNSLGLFPVTGQPLMLIGSPVFDEVILRIGEESFKIKAINNSESNIYVQSASLNGQNIERAYITIKELQHGGELVLIMGKNPTDWGCDQRPPSFND